MMTAKKMAYLLRRILAATLAFGCCVSLFACTDKPDDQPTSEDEDNKGNGGEDTPPTPERLYDTTLSEVIIERDGARLAINFCRDDVVHFRYAPAGEDFAPEDAVPESIAKYDDGYDVVYGEQLEDDDTVTLRTEGVCVSVAKSTLQIIITDASGKEIFRSAAEAFSSSGEGKTARFVRDVAGEEHFFGLGNAPGDTFTTTDHRNTVYDIWMSDDNVHAIIPLWYSTAGYGIYSNNSNRGSISFKSDYSLSVEGGEMNFYFFYGPQFKDILTKWSELAGRMAMPPLYALGLTYRGFGQWTEEQLLEALTSQLDAGISIDVAGVEPGWQTKTYPCTYAWAPKFTDDATSFVETMHALGLHVNLWEHPYVSPDATIAKEIAQYSLKGTDIGTRAWEGNNGTYAFGGLIPDMTIDEARELYWQIHDENLVSIGIDGYKIDETDSWGASNSLDLAFPGGLSNNAYHNLLGTLTVNLMHEKYRDEYNRRTFIFSRGNYAGMQRYATTAYTDYYGFDQFLMSIIAQSYSGTYYTPEIRDVSTGSDVDYMRRAQMMFLTPFAMSNEWASEATVLGRSDAVIECYQKYNQLHYALIPYMYSLFWEQHNTGVGVTRSLVMEFQNDPKTYDIDNQFMLGDALLVCPVNDKSRIATVKIYLPAGERWMDFNSGYVYEGGQTIEYTCAAATLPLFVRMGSILPLGHYGDNTSDVIDTTLTLDIYPSADKSVFTLYEDDGISYDYTSGKYATTTLSAQLQDSTITCTLDARNGAYAVGTRDCVLQIHYRSNPTEVTLDGKTLTAAASLDALYSATSPCYFYDGNAASDIDRIIYVRLTDDGKAHTVTAKVGAQGAQKVPTVVLNGTLYECEDAGNEFVGASVATGKKNASGKALVGSVGNNGKNYLTMKNITVQKDGNYEVEILYFNGEKNARMLDLSINGGEVLSIHCYSTGGWDTYGSISLIVPLKAGSNSIKLTTLPGNGWAPDLDAIIVYDEDTVNTTPGGTIYKADQATLSGSLTLESNIGAVNGTAIGGFGTSEDTRATWKVTVDKAGPYQLNLLYANPMQMAQSMDLYINGEKSVISLPGTMSTQLFHTLNMTIYLVAGENTIAIGCKGGAAIYECEVGGDYVSCNTQLNDGGAHEHSGGYCVGAGANNGGCRFTMNGITVPADGTYTLQVYAASGDMRTFRLKVNGEDVGDKYKVQTGHFHAFKPLEIKVNLKKGANTLTFWQDTTAKGDTLWLPNFDFVAIDGVAASTDVRIDLITIQ